MLILVVFSLLLFNLVSSATYEVVEQCKDRIRNYDETGIDCGGKCGECGINARVIENENRNNIGNESKGLSDAIQKIKETIPILFPNKSVSPMGILFLIMIVIIVIILFISKKIIYK